MNQDELRADLAEHAKFFGELTEMGAPRIAPPARTTPAVQPATAARTAPVAVAAAAQADALTAVRTDLGDCTRCKLSGTRKNIVFGQGNPAARLMFVGEAPGADEDEQGLAFVGRAGKLLTDIIAAMGYTRDDVYIANILKCRPPGNRNPEPDEIGSCQPFLERQIDAIKPEVLVGLGKFPGQWLLRTTDPISRIRGVLGEYRGIKVMPTYHPAYLLRNPAAKKDVWKDMKVVMSLLQG